MRHRAPLGGLPYGCFNPRTHEECDPLFPLRLQRHMQVSIHALTRSATIHNWFLCKVSYVSIHALTRSATFVLVPAKPVWLVSIHALTRSATCCFCLFHVFLMFQSTHSRGVRRALVSHFLLFLVSIHALTRSATSSLSIYLTYFKFQSTHSRGVRLCLAPSCRSIRVSIHALTRSATQRYKQCLIMPSFNPRTHEECDQNGTH